MDFCSAVQTSDKKKKQQKTALLQPFLRASIKGTHCEWEGCLCISYNSCQDRVGGNNNAMPFPEREHFWMDLPFLLGQNNQGKHYFFFHFTLQRQHIHEKKIRHWDTNCKERTRGSYISLYTADSKNKSFVYRDNETYCHATQKQSPKMLPQMTVINVTNVELLKLKLGTRDLWMTHYTNLINVSKDKEGCIQEGRMFNKVRLTG